MIPNAIKTKGIVKKIGDSYYLLINKEVRNKLMIENEVILGCKMWNVLMVDLECPVCKYKFREEQAEEYECINCDTVFSNKNIPNTMETKVTKEVETDE